MRLAREIERRLERLVEGATAAVFGGKLHPVDIAFRMVRQLEFLEEEGFAGPQIPNALTVSLSPADLDDTIDGDLLRTELARSVEVTAAERGWRINGPVTVEIETDESVPRGMIECEGTVEAGPIEPWGQLIALDGSDGANPLADNRVMIGRALQCDVRVPVPEVSRQHAIIVRTEGGFSISDLGSSNGTYVNGRRLSDGPAQLVPGDEIVVGTRRFGFRTV